ncbi:MAG: DUF917 domain-containing protein [Thermomicrobiales bacterium]
MTTRQLTSRTEIEDFVHGLVLFGTGGGGGPAAGIIKRLTSELAAGTYIGWTDIDDLPDDTWTFSIAGVGGRAPAEGPDQALLARTGLSKHRYEDFGDMLLEAARTLTDLHAVEPGAIIAVELGSSNTVTPMLVAARLGIPLIDGDYCGRAKPEIQQSMLEIAGHGVWPLVFVDRWGDIVHIPNAVSSAMVDRIGRHLCSASFGGVAVARSLLPSADARNAIVRGSCEMSLQAGRVLRQARESGDDPVVAIVEHLGGAHLFDGKVERIEEDPESGYQFHLCTHHLTGEGAFDGKKCAVWVKNEHHIVWVDDRCQAMSRDIIALLDRSDGRPLTNHEIEPGLNVAVIAMPPLDDRWRLKAGIDLLGPRAFGSISITSRSKASSGNEYRHCPRWSTSSMTASPIRQLDLEALQDLAVGSALLGTGGGGDPFIGRIITEQAIRKFGPVEVISPDELVQDDLVVVISMSGAPTVMTEKIPNGEEMDRVFNLAVEHAGCDPRAVISFEIGGMNSLFPVAVAARHGLPLVDADGMGRAFPEFQITSFNAGGVRFGPRFITDEKGNVLRIDGIDATWLEKINRRALVAMGGSVISAIGLTGEDVRQASIHGSISLACAIGRTLSRPGERGTGWLQRLEQVCPVLPLFKGKVISVNRRVEGGWVKGHAEIAGLEVDGSQTARIDFQNEHLLLRSDVGTKTGRVLGSTPDLLAVLDSETGLPITTERLHYGQRVTIIGIPCDPIWRTERGLELAGPRYFGWDIEYVPIEKRMESALFRLW